MFLSQDPGNGVVGAEKSDGSQLPLMTYLENAGLALHTSSGQPVTLPSIAVGDDATIADRLRVGGFTRVESSLGMDATGLQGAGVTTVVTPSNAAVIDAYNYDTSAQIKLTLKALELDLNAPEVKGTVVEMLLTALLRLYLGTRSAATETATPVKISLGDTLSNVPKSSSRLKVVLFDDSSANTFGFTVAPPIDGSDRHSLEYHTNNIGGYHSKHSFCINEARHAEVDMATAAGETSLTVFCFDTGTVMRIKASAPGAVSGVSGRVLYL